MTHNEQHRLVNGMRKLIGNCVDAIGIPKKPTAKQLYSAIYLLNKYEKKLKSEL